jgi:putative aldouronate transport system substrate-binding protein
MKKGILLLLAIMLIFSGTLFANGGREKEEAAVAANEPMNLSWMAYQTKPVDQDAYLIKLVEDKFNVDIDLVNVDNTKFDEIMGIKFASGEIPDRFSTGAGNRFEKMAQFHELGVLAKIPEDMIKKYMPDYYRHILKDVPGTPTPFDYSKIDGNIMALPDFNKGTEFRLGIAYRGDWMENVGVTKTPDTIEEFEDLMYKFAKNDPDGNGKKDTYGLSRTAMNMVFGMYGYIVGGFPYVDDIWREKDGQLVFGPAQPELKEALAYLTKWYADGVLDPEFITGENTGGYWALSHAFIEGKIGVSLRGGESKWTPTLVEGVADTLHVGELRKVNPQAADKIILGKPLMGPDGKRGGVFKWNGLLPQTVFGVQLEDDPAKMQKIMEIMNWSLSSFDNYLLAGWGVEGEHWEYKEGSKTPSFIKAADGFGYEDVGGGALFRVYSPFEYLNKMANPVVMNWKYENELDKYGLNSQLLAPLPSATKYQEELKKIQEEAFISIITGDKPLSYYDEYMTRWWNSGGKVLTEEANAWYANVK